MGLSWCARRGPRNKTSRKFKFSNMLDFAVCTRCMPSRRLRRLDKPLARLTLICEQEQFYFVQDLLTENFKIPSDECVGVILDFFFNSTAKTLVIYREFWYFSRIFPTLFSQLISIFIILLHTFSMGVKIDARLRQERTVRLHYA